MVRWDSAVWQGALRIGIGLRNGIDEKSSNGCVVAFGGGAVRMMRKPVRRGRDAKLSRQEMDR